MFDVCAGVILNLLAFAAIGIGPALSLLSAEKRIEVALAIAPALGFALTSIFGTYLVILDKPVSDWATPWLAVSVAISLAMSLAMAWKKKLEFAQVSWHLVKVLASGLAVTTILVVMPAVVGGLNFIILRGNGADSFNYITLAGYLDHEPYSWAWKADLQSLIDRHPSYNLARQLLSSRWTTSAILAYTSRTAGVPLYRFEYGFSVLSFILAFGPAFWFSLLMRARPFHAMLLAMAICVGFWGQFVLDIRALSQMNSIPILLLLVLLVSRIESNPNRPRWTECVLLSISLSALVLLYVEIVPLVIFGLAIFWATRLIRGGLSIPLATRYILSALMVVAGVLPIAPFLVRYFRNVTHYAGSGQNNWHQAYFSWFYSNPLSGLWGPSYLLTNQHIGKFIPIGLLNASMALLGVLLSFSLVCLILYFVTKKESPPAISLTASFIVASLIQFIFMLSRGQLWAAGKGLSFGYPFIVTGLVASGLIVWRSSKWPYFLREIVRGAVGLWIVLQCLLAIYRIGYAFAGTDYPNYISHNGEYRRHDWNMAPFSDLLQREGATTVGFLVSNPAVCEYLGFLFGWDVNLINLDGIRDRSGVLVGQQTQLQPPDYLIVDKDSWWKRDEPAVVSQNSELFLIKVPRDKPVLLSLRNPNGFEASTAVNQLFWMGGDATHLKLVSPTEGDVVFEARFIMGPSLPERSDRKMVIHSSATDQAQQVTITESTREIGVPVRQGLNEIKLQITDQPSVPVQPSGDNRPLLLGVRDLELSCKKHNR